MQEIGPSTPAPTVTEVADGDHVYGIEVQFPGLLRMEPLVGSSEVMAAYFRALAETVEALAP